MEADQRFAQLEMKFKAQDREIDRLSKAVERLSALATAVTIKPTKGMKRANDRGYNSHYVR